MYKALNKNSSRINSPWYAFLLSEKMKSTVPNILSRYYAHWKLQLILLSLLLFINYVSYKLAFSFFFVHDDLAMLWSSTYNPAEFFASVVGAHGILLTGVFHYLIFRLYAIFPSSLFWQEVGFSIRALDGILVYFLLTQMTSKRYAYMGALLAVAYAGGIEAYTWHPATALAVTFCIATFYFYFKFIKTENFLLLLPTSICIFLAFLSYIGRAMGIIIFMFLYNMLYLLFQRSNLKTNMQRVLVGVNIVLIVLVLFIIRISPTNRAAPTMSIILQGIKAPSVFFESTGNLLKIPYLRTVELGGLALPSTISLFVGIIILVLGGAIGVYSYKKRSQWGFNIMLGVLWVYVMYVFNWFFGGGNTSTLVGSMHRYLSMSAIGVIIITTLLLQKVPKYYQVIVLIVLLFLNLRYTQYILANEGSIRNKTIVEPVYKAIMEKTKGDSTVQFIVVDTPNKLKSFVVQGWMPYTFAYYKGLSHSNQFPMVFPDSSFATQWLCADKSKQIQIQQLVGVVNYRQDPIISPSHIYAWHLEENGILTDQTDDLRRTYEECLQKEKPEELQ